MRKKKPKTKKCISPCPKRVRTKQRVLRRVLRRALHSVCDASRRLFRPRAYLLLLLKNRDWENSALQAEIDRYHVELRLMISLSHPNILTLCGARASPPEYFLLFPYQENGRVVHVSLSFVPSLESRGAQPRYNTHARFSTRFVHSQTTDVGGAGAKQDVVEAADHRAKQKQTSE